MRDEESRDSKERLDERCHLQWISDIKGAKETDVRDLMREPYSKRTCSRILYISTSAQLRVAMLGPLGLSILRTIEVTVPFCTCTKAVEGD